MDAAEAATEANQIALCVVTLLHHLAVLQPDNGIHLLAIIARVEDLYAQGR